MIIGYSTSVIELPIRNGQLDNKRSYNHAYQYIVYYTS